MKLFKCLISGDELFTDTYRYTMENGFYKIRGKNVTRSNKIDDALLGANASAEEANEEAEDGATTGIDVVIDNRLEEFGQFPDKKEYKKYFADYVKQLKTIVQEKYPDRDIKEWMTNMQAAFTHACSFIKDCDCYIGGSREGTVVLCRWEVAEGETDDSPYFYFYKDALVEEKL